MKNVEKIKKSVKKRKNRDLNKKKLKKKRLLHLCYKLAHQFRQFITIR